MSAEKQPVSELTQIQGQQFALEAIIAKRQALLGSIPWVITRADPDIEQAAKLHAQRIIAETIPASIARFQQRLSNLQEERNQYMQKHAPELKAGAQAHQALIETEEKIINRIARDIKKGYSTQEILDQRTAHLQDLKILGHLNPDLQAGSELLIQQEHAQEIKSNLIPPLLPLLKPIVFDAEENGEKDESGLVYTELRRSKYVDESERTAEQNQLLEDIRIIEQFSDSVSYQKKLTVSELHIIAVKAKELFENPNQFPSDPVKTSKVIRTAWDVRIPGDSFIPIKDSISKAVLFQAALDVLVRDVYRARLDRIKSPERVNAENFSANLNCINAWYEQAKPELSKAMAGEKTARTAIEIEKAISGLKNRHLTEKSNKYEVGKAISAQLRIGHLVDDLNSAIERSLRNRQLEEAVQETIAAEAIPDLLPQLDRIISLHEHKYNTGNTISAQVKAAEAVEPRLRTAKQQQLLEDVDILGLFTDSTKYQEIYTPSELHDLVKKLQLLSQKNRPDFDGIEDQILRILDDQRRKNLLPIRNITMDGLMKRADIDTPHRLGMQWDTLVETAGVCSKVIANSMSGSDQLSYLIDIGDPQPDKDPDLTSVYTFVAYNHALDTLGQRRSKTDKLNQEIFVANYQVITTWYAQNAEVLDKLQKEGAKRLVAQIKNMLNTMYIRSEGEEIAGAGKNYRIDPVGAITLQKKIGYTVEEIKTLLAKGEGEIIPLEP